MFVASYASLTEDAPHFMQNGIVFYFIVDKDYDPMRESFGIIKTGINRAVLVTGNRKPLINSEFGFYSKVQFDQSMVFVLNIENNDNAGFSWLYQPVVFGYWFTSLFFFTLSPRLHQQIHQLCA